MTIGCTINLNAEINVVKSTNKAVGFNKGIVMYLN